MKITAYVPPQKSKANGEDKFLDGVQDQVIVELESAANIKPEPMLWLWENWLALGKLHILAGQPGKGKSTIPLKIAAAVSSGGELPDAINVQRGNVIIWSGEDDASDTLTPRLEAAGADMSRVHIVRRVKERTFSPYARRSRPLAARTCHGGCQGQSQERGNGARASTDCRPGSRA